MFISLRGFQHVLFCRPPVCSFWEPTWLSVPTQCPVNFSSAAAPWFCALKLMAWVPVTCAERLRFGSEGGCVPGSTSSRALLPHGGFLWQEVEPFSTLAPVGRKRSERAVGHAGTVGHVRREASLTGSVGENKRKPLFLTNTDKHLFRSPICSRTTKFNSRKYRSRERLKSFIKLKSSFPPINCILAKTLLMLLK